MYHINWISCNNDPREGFGYMSLKLVQAMTKVGIHVHPVAQEQLTWPQKMRRMAGVDLTRHTFFLGQPTMFDLSQVAGRVWFYAMYEWTKIPQEWPLLWNQFTERVLTPWQWSTDLFIKNGVTVPVHTVGAGVAAEEFPVVNPHIPHDRFTFMALGDRGGRKGHDIVWNAFYKAFGGEDESVRLIIKTREDGLKFHAESESDPRVTFWRHDADHMNQVYPEADVFVFPTRGEGYGMPPREAACMGIPTLAPNEGGTSDVENWGIPITEYQYVPYADRGDWLYCDPDSLAEQLKWCYNNYKEAKQTALHGARWLRDNQSWDLAAANILDLLKEYANGAEFTRRRGLQE